MYLSIWPYDEENSFNYVSNPYYAFGGIYYKLKVIKRDYLWLSYLLSSLFPIPDEYHIVKLTISLDVFFADLVSNWSDFFFNSLYINAVDFHSYRASDTASRPSFMGIFSVSFVGPSTWALDQVGMWCWLIYTLSDLQRSVITFAQKSSI